MELNYLKPYFEERLQVNQLPDWQKLSKKAAFEQVIKTGLPSDKHEKWRFTDLSEIEQNPLWYPLNPGKIQSTTLSKDELSRFLNFTHGEDHLLVFLNGRFSGELSRYKKLKEEIEFETVANILKLGHGEKLQKVLSNNKMPSEDAWQKLLDQSHDSFRMLNEAFFLNGIYLRIPRRVQMKKTINIVHITTASSANAITSAKNFILIEKEAKASIVESHLSFSEICYLRNFHNVIKVCENAKLGHTVAQAESEKSFNMGVTSTQVERNGHYNSFVFTVGGKLSRHQLNISLNEHGASCQSHGLYALTEKQQCDNYTSILHLAPYTESEQLYKGILDDTSHAVFDGHVLIDRDAQKASASQLNKNLLLTKEAQINTQPQLEILADDVKATHGATIGQLSDDQLFYLQSRGIAKDKALELLTHAFSHDVILKVENPFVQNKLNKILIKKVENCSRKIKNTLRKGGHSEKI
ncbi:MAG: Fe-S cluster assembly protein SufD [Bacteriovoracia bacterium]